MQGGAGIVKLEIRSWINRLLIGEWRWWEKMMLITLFWVAFFATAGFSFMRFASVFFIFSYIAPFLNIKGNNWAKSRRERIEEEAQAEKRHKQLDLAFLREPYTEQYRSIIQHKWDEQQTLFINQNILDTMRYHVHKDIFKTTAFAQLDSLAPQYVQAAYTEYYQKLQHITESDLGQVADFQNTPQNMRDCKDAIQYLLAQQYLYSRLAFTQIIETVITHQIEAQYFIDFLAVECNITSNFYEYGEGNTYYSPKAAYQTSHHLGDYVPIINAARPEPQGIYATQINEWLNSEIKILREQEMQKINAYLHNFPEYSRFIQEPFLIECMEGVLFI